MNTTMFKMKKKKKSIHLQKKSIFLIVRKKWQRENINPAHLAYYFDTDPGNIISKQFPEPRSLTAVSVGLQRACGSPLFLWDYLGYSVCSLHTHQLATFSRLQRNGKS